MDVRLADYGVSQFSTPSGLRRCKGTEEYMAPELFRSYGNQTYDEKVRVLGVRHWAWPRDSSELGNEDSIDKLGMSQLVGSVHC